MNPGGRGGNMGVVGCRKKNLKEVAVNRLKELRAGQGMTLMGLAQAVGSTPTWLVYIEKYGHMPEADLRQRIASALGVGEGEVWPTLGEAEEARVGAVT